MNAFSDFDLDEQALAKKPRPLGWFFFGVAVIGAAAIAFGLYLPLSDSHEKLLAEYTALAKKSKELDHSLKQANEKLDTTEKRRSELRSYVDGGADLEKKLKVSLEQAQATAENQLKVYKKKKWLELSVANDGLLLSFSNRVIFRGKTSKPAPRVSRILCKAVGSLKAQTDWTVEIVTRAPAGEKEYWEMAGERSAALAKTIEQSCKIPADRIFARTERSDDDKNSRAQFTDLRVGPKAPPRLKITDAPKAATSGK